MSINVIWDRGYLLKSVISSRTPSFPVPVKQFTWNDDEDERSYYTSNFEVHKPCDSMYGIKGNKMVFVKNDVPCLDVYCRCIANFSDDDYSDEEMKCENEECVSSLIKAVREHMHDVQESHTLTHKPAGADTLVVQNCTSNTKLDVYCRCTVQGTDSEAVAHQHVAWFETLEMLLRSFLYRVHESKEERHAKHADIRLCTTNVDVNSLPADKKDSFLENHKRYCMEEYGRLVPLEYRGCNGSYPIIQLLDAHQLQQ